MVAHTKQISPEEQSVEGLTPASGTVTDGDVSTGTGVSGSLTRTLFVALALVFGFVNSDIFQGIVRMRLEEGKEICAVFFDVKKAFDSVPHRPLITKLQQMGVPYNLLV